MKDTCACQPSRGKVRMGVMNATQPRHTPTIPPSAVEGGITMAFGRPHKIGRIIGAVVAGMALALGALACGGDASSSPTAVTVATQATTSLDPTVTPTEIPTPTATPTPTPAPIKGVNFTGIVTSTSSPSQIQVVFSLRDQEGHAVVLPAEQIAQGLRVFEMGQGTGGVWEEIDYTETSFFVHTAENVDLEIVFVLDFTNSMSEARLSDGRSGTEAMIEAFEASLAVLPSAHRVGVVEFHDRNVAPGVLSPLTTDRQAVRDSVREFQAGGFDSGSSRVWDSIVTGSELFSIRWENPRAVRALVFLSDGRDTSSERTRERAAEYASERGVQLYAVSVGEVYQEAELRSAARSTGGAYYSARDIDLIQNRLQSLVGDLRGQYQLTYITLRRSGEYRVGVKLESAEIVGETEVGPFDVARFFGADNQGVIGFDPPSIDRANNRASVFMRALHVPRNIDHIRFRARTSKPLLVELVSGRDGGLLEGWTLSGPDANGWYEASSSAPLEFGSLGLLAKLTIYDLTEDGIGFPVEFDNTIYSGGKSLARPQYVEIGDVPLRRIVFTSDRDGENEVFVMNADGTGVEQLTYNLAVESVPSWSPDGRRILFQSDRDGEGDIYVMNADGTGVARLTENPAGDYDPSWSPDGRRVAFESYRDGNYEIYVVNADGTGVARLTENPAGDYDPNWSPDGRHIVFHSERDGNREIYVMNADGTGVTRLTENPAGDYDPSWSPDGRRIAFETERDGNAEIYVMNADGTGVERLTDNSAGDYDPSWSPDGRHIGFHSTRDGNVEIYVMNADGTGVIRLTDNWVNDWNPSWSP